MRKRKGSVSKEALEAFGFLSGSFHIITYLSPGSIALLDDLRDGPAFGVVASLAQHVLHYHGGREGRGDGEDFEVAVLEEEDTMISEAASEL